MGVIIPLIITVLLYLFMGWITKDLLISDMKKLGTCREYPRDVEVFLYVRKSKLIDVCALLWPLYLFYRIGVVCGNRMYKTIVKDDENRFAAWFF